MKQAIFFWIILLSLGWFANDVFSYNHSMPSVFVSKELISPGDRIQDNQVLVYNDRIVIYVDDANWAKYTNTNSMDGFLDEGTTGIEVRPEGEFDVQIGDVITYDAEWSEALIAHRVIDVGYDQDGWYAIAKGDNVAYADPGKIRFEQIEFILVGVLY